MNRDRELLREVCNSALTRLIMGQNCRCVSSLNCEAINAQNCSLQQSVQWCW